MQSRTAKYLSLAARCLAPLVFCLLLPSAFAAPSEPRPGAANSADTTASEIKSLQEQVRVLDKDTAVNKAESTTRLEAQDKRISDLATQTAQVGNHIAWTSAVAAVLMTLFAVLIGVFTYVGVTKRARAESREAAAEWFDENEKGLVEKFKQLELKANALEAKFLDAGNKINKTVDSVETTADTAHSKIKEIQASAAKTLLDLSLTNSDESARKPDKAQEEAEAVIAKADLGLKQKPEAEFSDVDYFMRALSYQTKQSYPAALESIDLAIQAANTNLVSAETLASYLFLRSNLLYFLGNLSEAVSAYDDLVLRFGEDAAPGMREQMAKALVNKGLTLTDLGQRKEAVAVFEELERRYGEDAAPGMNKQVASALIASGFNQILEAKQSWAERVLRQSLLDRGLEALARARQRRVVDGYATLLGNLGYCQFLLGDIDAALVNSKKCFELGGQASYTAQLEDAKVLRVEPEDTAYEVMLLEVWAEVRRGGESTT